MNRILVAEVLLLCIGMLSANAADKPTLKAELVKEAVAQAQAGDTKLLSKVERTVGRGKDIAIPTDLLPVFHSLLQDDDTQIQRLGLIGISHFKIRQSQNALTQYVKRMDPRKLEEEWGDDPEHEPEYSRTMTNVGIAISLLGEIADRSVLPLLESLKDVQDLKKLEWAGDIVAKAIAKAQDRESRTEESKDDEQTFTVEIAENQIPLVFADDSLPANVKGRIAGDIQLCLSRNISVVLRSRKPSLVRPWQGHPVTHKVSEVKDGRFYQLHSAELPSMIREHFGDAAMIDGVPHLIVGQKLIAAYKSSMEAQAKHPRMMKDLESFLDLLQNPVELKEIAGDQERAEQFVYCYRVSQDAGLTLLQTYVGDISAAHKLTIRQPTSLLDIIPLGLGFEDEDAPEGIYIVSVMVSGQETPDSEPFSHLLPLGAYVDGKWRLFAWPIP